MATSSSPTPSGGVEVEIDFSSLLAASATRHSLQMGRDLSEEEMAELEAELEKDIAQQMMEDEMGEDEAEDKPTSLNSTAIESPLDEAVEVTIEPLATPSQSKRKSFMELAAHVTPATRRLSTGLLSPSMESHRRTASQDVTERLLLSPAAPALVECMRAAAEHVSPAQVGPLATGFMFSSPAPGQLISMTITPSPIATRLKLEHEPVAVLLERLEKQEDQILQAGQLGQQLITEMEEMETRFTAELEAKRAENANLAAQLDRALKKYATQEKHAAEWKAQVQSGLDAIDVLSQELVKAQSKGTIFEAAKRKLEAEIEESKARAGKAEQIAAECPALQERIQMLESRQSQLTGQLSALREEHSCVSLELAARVQADLASERTLTSAKKELAQADGAVRQLKNQLETQRCQAEMNIAELTQALEEATHELEKAQFALREEVEKAKLLQQATAAPMQTSNSDLPSTGHNARLATLPFSSLLNELENELASPRRSTAPQIETPKDEELVDAIETIAAVEPIPAQNAVEEAASGRNPQHTRAQSVPEIIPAPRPHLSLHIDSLDDDDEGGFEGDSPSHPRVQTLSKFLALGGVAGGASAPSSTTARSLVKRPSSAQRFGRWLSSKVSEAEAGLLRGLGSTLTKSDGEESSESESEQESENKESAKKMMNNIQTPTNGKRIVVATPRQQVAATPISRTLADAAAARQNTQLLPQDDITASTVVSQSSSSEFTHRVDVLREYFHLTTLAVKLSSMDENLRGSNYSVQGLYEEAIREEIPFAQWHQWIERRLKEIGAQAQGHEILRPRAGPPTPGPTLTLPVATPGKPSGALAGIPKTPVNRIAASPIPIRSFETPNAKAHSQERREQPATPIANAPIRALGENMTVNNLPTTASGLQTPASMKSGAPAASAMRSVAATPATTHRPMVKGMERFQQRGSMTPTVRSSSGSTSQPIHPATVQRPVAPIPAPPQGLLSKFANFVTAAPAPQPRPVTSTPRAIRS